MAALWQLCGTHTRCTHTAPVQEGYMRTKYINLYVEIAVKQNLMQGIRVISAKGFSHGLKILNVRQNSPAAKYTIKHNEAQHSTAQCSAAQKTLHAASCTSCAACCMRREERNRNKKTKIN